MKNNQIKDNINKLLSKKKKLLAYATAFTLATATLTGCSEELLSGKATVEQNHDKQNKPNKQEKPAKKAPTLDLSHPDEVGDPYYLKCYDSENGGIDQKEERRGYVREVIKNEKKYLVDSDNWNKVLISDYVKIGEPYRAKYYKSAPDVDYWDAYYGNYVIDVAKGNGGIDVVDGKDFKTLLTNLEYTHDMNHNHQLDDPEHMEYYDSENGGKDNDNKSGYGNGWVYEVESNTNGKILLDASSLKVLLNNYTKKDGPKYMEYYDSENGGKDNDNKSEYGHGNGYVYEIEALDDLNYLVDASHPRIVLSGYDEMEDPFYDLGYEEVDIDNFGAGYLQKITKNGISYLVDANDWESILLTNYSSRSLGEFSYYDYDEYGQEHHYSIAGNALKAQKSSVLTK